MSTETPTSELLTVISNLYSQGFTLNETEAWILLECRDTPRSKNQLAEKRNLSYQAIHTYVKKLEAANLLTSIPVGKESYWKCPFDVTEVRDSTFRVTIEGQKLTFEELLYYLKGNTPGLLNNRIMFALSHVVWRLTQITEGDKATEPNSTVMREFVQNTHKDLINFCSVLQQIIDLPIWDDKPDTHKYLTATFAGQYTEQLIRLNNHILVQNWGTNLSRKGAKDKPTPKMIADYQAQFDPEARKD